MIESIRRARTADLITLMPSAAKIASNTAARLTAGGLRLRLRLRLRLDKAWPWATQLAQAFTRLHSIPAAT